MGLKALVNKGRPIYVRHSEIKTKGKPSCVSFGETDWPRRLKLKISNDLALRQVWGLAVGLILLLRNKKKKKRWLDDLEEILWRLGVKEMEETCPWEGSMAKNSGGSPGPWRTVVPRNRLVGKFCLTLFRNIICQSFCIKKAGMYTLIRMWYRHMLTEKLVTSAMYVKIQKKWQSLIGQKHTSFKKRFGQYWG